VLTGVLAALGSGLLFGIAAVWQARATRALPGSGRLPTFVRESARSRLMLLVLAAYLLGFLLHAVAIWLLPLYLAQATIALSMPVTALCSAYHLGEPLGARGWAGVAAVTLGIVLLALGAGPAGAVVTTAEYVGLLWGLLLVTLVLGLVAHRGGRAVLLGAVAGLGYAVSALAVRGVGAELGAATLAATLAVPTVSTIAFWLYSVAMTRTGVASATGAMLGVQTFGPAIVGILVLGDQIREGWTWAIVLGLAVTVLGAMSLATRHAELDPDSASNHRFGERRVAGGG
jgi:drug/metabolite transporter (DMT)-like permease